MAADAPNWASQYVLQTCDDVLRLLSNGQARRPAFDERILDLLSPIVQTCPAPVTLKKAKTPSFETGPEILSLSSQNNPKPQP